MPSAYKTVIQGTCKNCGVETNLSLVSITPMIWKGKCESCGQRMTAQAAPEVIAYLKTSARDQELEKIRAEISAFAHDHNLGKVNWVEAKVSGAKTGTNGELGQLLDALVEGDSIIVPRLAVLGRTTPDILDCLAVLRGKGINVYAVKGVRPPDAAIDAKAFLALASFVGEIERDLMSTRTKEALQARQEAGVKLGRPKGPGKSKLDQYRPEIETLLKNGSTLKYIARRYKSSEANLINWLKKNNIDRTPEYGQEEPSPATAESGAL